MRLDSSHWTVDDPATIHREAIQILIEIGAAKDRVLNHIDSFTTCECFDQWSKLRCLLVIYHMTGSEHISTVVKFGAVRCNSDCFDSLSAA